MSITQASRGYALFVTIPFVGHVNPLLAQAEELVRRGWRVAIATHTEARRHVEGRVPGVAHLDLGPLPPEVPSIEAFEAAASEAPDALRSMDAIFAWHIKIWPSMYDGLTPAIQRDRPDVMVVDLSAPAGIDAAATAGVPYLANNPDLLTLLAPTVLPPEDGVPLPLLNRSARDLGFRDRVLNRLHRTVVPHLLSLTIWRRLNAARATRGLAPVDWNARMKHRPILVNGAFGLEYPRTLPPNVHMVGPMITGAPEALPPDYDAWLRDGPPVAYVNLGTVARPKPEHVTKLAEALRSDAFRALWVLRKPAQGLLPGPVPPNVRVEAWVPDPRAILAHPNVRVFVSHCGINSVHEALAAGTPVVGLPFLADQQDMGLRVQDAGVGLLLDTRRFTAAALREAIVRVIRDPRFRQRIPAIQAGFRLAGGPPRAADLIEAYAAHGDLLFTRAGQV